MTIRLLEAGLNCIIPSIDGLTAEVHEAIRPRTNYEKIIKNVQNFIVQRDKMNANCKVLVRMVRQQLNKDQWNDYNIFWKELMSPEKGDDVIALDIHNTGGKVQNYDTMKVSNFENMEKEHWDHYTKSIDSGDYKKLTTPKKNDDKVYIKANEIEDLGGCPDLFSRFSIFA